MSGSSGGSIDGYNTLIFNFVDSMSQAILGSSFGALADDGVSRYFDFAATGSAIKSVVATSSIDAFEIDNVSFSAAVPEAATWTMMLGLDVVGGSLRRRSAATRVSFA